MTSEIESRRDMSRDLFVNEFVVYICVHEKVKYSKARYIQNDTRVKVVKAIT